MNWFVVYTTPRWEKKVAALLEERGMESYCPLNKVTRKWSDRWKVVQEPLFRGYVFVLLDPEKKWAVQKVPGIINFLHYNGKPAIVKDDEIDIIKKFLNEFDEVQTSNLQLETGNEVVIRQGVLMNYKGIVLEKTGNTAKILINSLGIQLTASFKTNNLQKL